MVAQERLRVDAEQAIDGTTIAKPIEDSTDDNNSEQDEDEEDEDEEDDFVDEPNTIASIRNLNKALTRNVRNQSYASYIARSQRNAFWGDEPPLSPEEESKRKVHFYSDTTKLSTIYIIPIIPENQCDLIWYNAKDYDRFDTESKLTLFRWENHLEGLIKFDESQNSLRGLELELSRKEQLNELKRAHKAGIKIDKKKQKEHVSNSKLRYIRDILREMNRQKAEGATGKTLDWDKIREVGLNISHHNVTAALQRAQSDELDRNKYLEEADSDNDNEESNNTHKGVFGTVKGVLSSKDRNTNNNKNTKGNSSNKSLNSRSTGSKDDNLSIKKSSSSSSSKNPLRFLFQKKNTTK